MRELSDIAREFGRSPDSTFALATLLRSKGSSYRRPGARMLIAPNGKTVGSLSGGCLEDEVVQKAQEVLKTGKPTLMAFDTRRRFGCNGSLEILIERASYNFLSQLFENISTRQAFTILTNDQGSSILSGPGNALTGLSQSIEPCPQLLIIGDGPESSALQSFAQTLGWLSLSLESANQLESSYDQWTAAIIKTHNYGRDFAALRSLLPLNLRYIGLVGPKSRREQLVGDLLDTGISSFPNLFAPAGLDLGADSPEEIALSIISEIQSIFAGGTHCSLRERKSPIHSRQTEPVEISL